MTGSGVEVLGRDVAREAYRVRSGDVVAFVPECLMDGLRPGTRPSHQEAYEWIAAHGPQLRRAVTALAQGETPKKPFDLMDLDAETPDAR
ncbi:hypothetical protein ACOXXX_00010 [Thalassococcus sp. BH17M4-6]|uniref:hypothetical protein n=1 Tax=Thalassococcus sp. BH17M4-6 TaxID=3413148 RepID=UPI003BE2BE6E